jgi:hypothetical protein
MKTILFSFYLFLIVFDASSQVYPFDSIPANLKRRSDAVIRSEQCLFKIIKPGNAVMRLKKAITLLNDDSKSYRLLKVYYDKFSRVNSLTGAVYDEKGKMIKTMGMNDVFDISAITGSSFYSDDRMKVLFFPVYKYPYTIEYEYEIEYSSLINYPEWSFRDSPDVSVERSGIQYVVPKDMKLRYFGENLKHEVDSVIKPDEKIYTWQEENLPVIISHNNYSNTEDSIPVLHTAPLDFEYGGIKGSMSSWKSFGDWVYSLKKGLDVLPESELAKVSEIASHTQNTREKIDLIYKYVQSRTRYVSVQIGIGGFRPADATAVATNGFGDCKALVNFTMALLKAAGINSFYTLVLAGETKQINKNFVNNQFNHVILCVPMQNDSIWLDCTSQILPFNYLGDFTADRYALLITPEGGKMVRTPGFTKYRNQIKRSGSIYLNILGASSGKISNSYSGYTYDQASSLFSLDSEEEIKRYLISVLSFSDFNITSASYKENKSESPSADLTYGISVNNFATTSGNRLFFSPTVINGEFMQDSPSDLEIKESQIATDSIFYNLPLGYKVESLPGDMKIKNEFGEFNYELRIINDKILFERYFKVNKGTVPVRKFYEFRSFVNSVASADRGKIILTKTNI